LPSRLAANAEPLRSPGPEIRGKVAAILRRYTCGVNRKDTIPSGRVAEGFSRSASPKLVRGKNFRRNPLSLFTTPEALPRIFVSETQSERTDLPRMLKGMWRPIAVAIFSVVAVLPVLAQQQAADQRESNAPAAPQPAPSAPSLDQSKVGAPAKAPHPPLPGEHSFWDRENDLLFAGVGAGRALDYASTLNLRRRGINEAFLTNSIVDNRPLFAGIEAAATAASIGVSYVFHRTGHHRLERWTSIIHFGVATGGAIRNYALETPD
jgi:hypothetical protein